MQNPVRSSIGDDIFLEILFVYLFYEFEDANEIAFAYAIGTDNDISLGQRNIQLAKGLEVLYR